MKLFLFTLYYFISFLACYAADILDLDDCSSDTEIIDYETFPIHFIWIGPPTKDTPTSMIGHDVVGPTSIAHQLRAQNVHHAITFWCLSQFDSYYQQYFSEQASEINVRSLDTHILEGLQNNDQPLIKLNEAFQKIDNQEDSDDYSIIMKNTLKKNGFSIYLLAYHYGYVMDTNLYPLRVLMPDSAIDINLFDLGSFTTMRGCSGHDYFCMFSPQAQFPLALDFFNLWLLTPWMYNFPSKLNIKTPPFLPSDIGLLKTSFKSYYSSHKKIHNFSDNENFYLFKLLMDYFFSVKTVNDLEETEENSAIFSPSLQLIGSHSLLHHCIIHGHDKAIEYLRSKACFEHLKSTYWCFFDGKDYSLTPRELELFLTTHARQNLKDN